MSLYIVWCHSTVGKMSLYIFWCHSNLENVTFLYCSVILCGKVSLNIFWCHTWQCDIGMGRGSRRTPQFVTKYLNDIYKPPMGLLGLCTKYVIVDNVKLINIWGCNLCCFTGCIGKNGNVPENEKGRRFWLASKNKNVLENVCCWGYVFPPKSQVYWKYIRLTIEVITQPFHRSIR